MKTYLGEGNLNAAIRMACVAVVSSLLSLGVYAQGTANGGTAPQPAPTTTTDESQLPIGDADGTAARSATVEAWPYFLRMVIVLALVAAAIYGVVWVMRSFSKPKTADDPYLRVLASTQLGPGRWLYIVSAGNRAFLVGATDGGIAALGELDDKELVDTLRLRADETPVRQTADFSSLLGAFMKPGKISADKARADELERQRDRLRRM